MSAVGKRQCAASVHHDHDVGEVNDLWEHEDSNTEVNSTEDEQNVVQSGPGYKQRATRREKGPPITCLMCAVVWAKSQKGGRLFMFGGARPFMARFEAKLKSLMGQEVLSALQRRSCTKFGRSYICRECYLLARHTYDNIRRVQRGVYKSIQMCRQLQAGATARVDQSDSDSAQDLEFDPQESSTLKKKLPPVAERIADKIAALSLVKINHKTPVILLRSLYVKSPPAVSQCTQDTGSSPPISQTYGDTTHLVQGSNISEHSLTHNLQEKANGEEIFDRSSLRQIGNIESYSQLHRGDTALKKKSSEFSEHINGDHASLGRPAAIDGMFDSRESKDTILSQQNDTEGSTNPASGGSAQDTMAKILANPLLLIKSPQPVRLAEVKNRNVYVCGQDGCTWAFSSRFFWTNHIRHYHRSGKPYLCPFEGCGRSFSGKSKLELHVRSHTDERPFICDKCGCGFRGNQELKIHRLTHTTEKPYECPKCDKNFKLLSSLKRHLQFHDGSNFPFPCTFPNCTKGFKSRYDLKCHIRLHTGEKPYKCLEPGCGLSFRIPCQFTMHKRSHTGERPFACSQGGCSAAFISSNALQLHMLSHSSDKPLCCEFCGKTFKHKMLYRMHLKKKTDCLGFLCPIESCGERYPNRKTMEEHMGMCHTDHNGKQQRPGDEFGSQSATERELCHPQQKDLRQGRTQPKENTEFRMLACPFDKCGREFQDSVSLHDHLKEAHASSPREKMCTSCGLAFMSLDQLKQHTECVHNFVPSGRHENVFVCHSERCGAHFGRLEDLEHHVSWHLGHPPYRCERGGCQRTFLLEAALTSHLADHDQHTPISCSFGRCQQVFTSNNKLLKHSKVHYGLFRCPFDGCGKEEETYGAARRHWLHHDKPFVCVECGRRFNTSPQWVQHQQRHTGEGWLQCKVCSTQFANLDELRHHKKVHQGDKPFMCEQCGQTSASLAAHNNHRKVHAKGSRPLHPGAVCGKRLAKDKSNIHPHTNASSLCSQCGKVYKLTSSKHKCRVMAPKLVSAKAGPGQGLQETQAHTLASVAPPPVVTFPVRHPHLFPTSQSSVPLPQQPFPFLHILTPAISEPLQHISPPSISQTLTSPQPPSPTLKQPIAHPTTMSIAQTVTYQTAHPVAHPVPHSATMSLGRPTTMSLGQPTTMSLGQPIAMSLGQPKALSLGQPTTMSLGQPTTMSLGQPTAMSKEHPVTMSIPNPRAISISNPTIMSIHNPTTMSIFNPTTMSLAPLVASSTMSLDHLISHTRTSSDQPVSHTTMSSDNLISHTTMSSDHLVSHTTMYSDHLVSHTMSSDHTISYTTMSLNHPVSHTTMSSDQPVSHTTMSSDHLVSHTTMSSDHLVSHTMSSDHTISHTTMSLNHPVSHTTMSSDQPVSHTRASSDHLVSHKSMSLNHPVLHTIMSSDQPVSHTTMSISHPVFHLIPHSIVQPVTRSTTLSKAHPVTHPAPQTIAHPALQTIAHPAPQTIAHPGPQTIPHSTLQSLAQPSLQTIIHPALQTLTYLKPQNIAPPIPQNIAPPIPQNIAPPIPQTIPYPPPQTIAHPTPQTIAQRIPLTLPQSLPQVLSRQPAQLQQSPQCVNDVIMSQPSYQSYVVEEAARAVRQNLADTLVVEPHYNFIILYDRPALQ